MKFHLLAQSTLAVLILAACGVSKTPDESDVASVLKNQLVNCPITEIKNVTKINGAPSERENYYVIKATFDLVFKPIPENIELWNVFLQKRTLLESVEAEFDIPYKAIYTKKKQLEQELEAASNNSESYESRQARIDMFHEQKDQLDAEQSDLNNRKDEKIKQLDLYGGMSGGLDGLIVKEAANIRKSCKTEGLGTQLVGRAFFHNEKLAERAEFLANGGTISYTVDWVMMKTEKGWQLKL